MIKQNLVSKIVELVKYSKQERIARDLVRSYFDEDQVIEFAPCKNGSVRFSVDYGWMDGFYRIRKNVDRGLSGENSASFDQAHIGKITIATERKQGRALWDFTPHAE